MGFAGGASNSGKGASMVPVRDSEMFALTPIMAFLRSARSQVGPAFGEGRAVARHFHRRDPLAGTLGAGVHARRPADLDALEDLDLLPVGDLPVARQVDRQRPGGGAGGGVSTTP